MSEHMKDIGEMDLFDRMELAQHGISDRYPAAANVMREANTELARLRADVARLTSERDAAVERATMAENVVIAVVQAWDHYSASLGDDDYDIDDDAIHDAFDDVAKAVGPYHAWKSQNPAAPAPTAQPAAVEAIIDLQDDLNIARDFWTALRASNSFETNVITILSHLIGAGWSTVTAIQANKGENKS